LTPRVRVLGDEELADWDELAVEGEGGHILQSRAWAAHRAAGGWRPRFLAVDNVRALVLVRGWPAVGGGSAYAPRGPVAAAAPWRDDDAAAAVGRALAAIARTLEDEGIDVLAADPEVPAANDAYRRGLDAAGFHPIPEIQPSRHRMALTLPGVDDAAGVLAGVAKSTRQRIRRAERDQTIVVRHDSRWAPDGERPASPGAPGTPSSPGAAGSPPGEARFARPTEPAADALGRFYTLLQGTGERRGFGFSGPDEFVRWWTRALEAGHLVYLEARDGDARGDVLGGLVLYRHGRRLSTAHSADPAERRRERPGTMHLLRWRAIEIALEEGRTEMDLGGVDVAGARRPPEPGEATHGLYEHKRSFGATWLAMAGAHERVARPWRYALGRAMTRVSRLAGAGTGSGS
jgi:lipid II:glycine glycyltransferase (peptidoglycan interpeptide bridge formation enzyme)